jgi:hypothetical protein
MDIKNYNAMSFITRNLSLLLFYRLKQEQSTYANDIRPRMTRQM